MTLLGAIKQLQQLQNAEDMPFYYKPSIAEVINVLLMDTQEMRHGYWIGVSQTKFEQLFFSQRVFKCSVCGNYLDFDGVNAGRGSANFCPNCGAKMDEVAE